MTGMSRKRRRALRKWMAMIVVLAVLACAAIAAAVLLKNREEGADIADADAGPAQVVTEQREQPESDPVTEPEEIPYEGIPETDFEELWKTNTDVCAWITVPGTQVDYPVLQNASSQDLHDTYYLEHTFERASGLPGAIYIEPCNAGDFTDLNTVIYGHNMKNGSMFGSLHEFEDNEFFDEHEYVYLVTPEKILVYRIFAAVIYSDRHLTGTFDFTTAEGCQVFLDELAGNRDMRDQFREDMEVTAGERMVTLSTCVKGEDDRRLLIGAVLTDEYEH